MVESINKQEKIVLRRREFIIKGSLGCTFVVLGARLWNLQLINGNHYKKLSEENRIHLISISGTRGLIYDKKNSLLAKNLISYDLVVIPDKHKDIRKIFQKVSSTLGIPYRSLLNNFKINKKRTRFVAIKIYNNLTWKQVTLVEAYQEEFPGISVDISQIRYYTHKKILIHALGYMNQINLKNLKEININQVKSASFIGNSGIEKYYNSQLLGTDGSLRIENNSAGKVIESQYVKTPVSGSNLHLNLDLDLQIHIYSVLKERKGAVIVMNPQNGKVIAMCSNPTFNPNRFSSFLSQKEWSELINNTKGFLNNRCVQGLYSPGSTFKMVVAIAALEEGLIDEEFTYTCNGHYKLNNKLYYCWKKSGHGKINLIQAIAASCNTFFYQIGLKLGVDKIYEYATKLQLGEISGIDLPTEKKGTIPNKAWKEKNKKSRWFLGETVGVSIGQSYITVTPIQLLTYLNAMVNGGNIIQPRILDYIDQPRQKIDKINIEHLGFDPKNLELILEGMRQSVSSKIGTSKSAANSTFSIGGKTGTTQVISYKTRRKIIEEKGKLDSELEDHAWFIGFAPAKEPQLTIAVLLENGKAGRYAAATARQILQPYFRGKLTAIT